MMTVIHNIGTIFILVVLAFDVYVGYDVYKRYKASTEPVWYHRLYDACHDSFTIVWTKFCTGLATIVLFLDPIAELLGGDEAKNALNATIGNPKIMAAVVLGVTAITYAARMRSILQGLKGTP